jgi:PilZ domain
VTTAEMRNSGQGDWGEDRRQHRRYRIAGQVSLTQLGLDAITSSQIIDLSLGGCLLSLTPIPLLSVEDRSIAPQILATEDFTAQSTVEAHFHSYYLLFLATARVQRIDQGHDLIGLSFLHLTKHGRSDLQNLLRDLEDASSELDLLQPGTKQAFERKLCRVISPA